MTRAVLPFMRAHGAGHIVNISSIGGLVGNAGGGYYNAAKFAVEGLSEALSKEVAPLGIKVLIVEPGPFRTDWAGRSLKTPERSIEAYAATAIARRRMAQATAARSPANPARRRGDHQDRGIARPPLRLVLGAVALGMIRTEAGCDARRDRRVQALTLAADYPKSN